MKHTYKPLRVEVCACHTRTSLENQLLAALCQVMKAHRGRGPSSMKRCDCKACVTGREAIYDAESVR